MSGIPEIAVLERARLAEARELLERACAYERASVVANEVLFAPGLDHEAVPLAAFLDGRLVGVVVHSGPWVRLLAVAPEYRGRGVGTALLHAAERGMAWPARHGSRVVRVMTQPGNYLAPGVDTRDRETIAWLARRGYVQRRENTNLIIDLLGNPAVTREHAERAADAARAQGFSIARAARARADDESARASLLADVTRSFSRGWAFELERALEHTPAGVHLARARDGALAAFAAHDGNNQGLGWFGPAGTLDGYRGRGLGKALLLACLVDVKQAGHAICEIAWIGPRQFYERSVGVAGERTFAVLEKELPPP